MTSRFYNRIKKRVNILLYYISFLWKMSFKKYYQATDQISLTPNTSVNKNEKCPLCRYVYLICIVIIFLTVLMIFFMVHFFIFVYLPEKARTSAMIDMDKPETETILSDRQNETIHYIHIDIGCFNGETIEHFIHFIPNSTIYDIITFEPDPNNYQLCKQRLTQKKYENINILILPQVVWIRDEKVFFQANHGQLSRMTINKTATNNDSIELDAINFSSWLARLAKPNQAKISIKMSMPGAEVPVLEKMVLDGTLGLADKYEVEWTDRENPHFRSTRIYLQLMFDSYGFDCLYYTRLEDARHTFTINGSFINITKYYDWKAIGESDTYAHYAQRPDVFASSRILNRPKQK